MTGRRAGFEQAVGRCFGGLYHYAFWLCRDRWQAEDVVQESLLRAWCAWPALRDRRAVKAWLFTIVRHESLRAVSRSPRADTHPAVEEPQYEPDHAGKLDLERALRGLSAESRDALLLQVVGGFTCLEIARVLGATEGAVMTRLTRARQALRRALGERDDGKRQATA